ncbi:unnamed protein product [Didymodactylos carnosus]|uniref:Envelope protein n=1 Tax=Didymodactylos carnosus TaxID=1234261 RepID=A0A8S2EZF7_9BILA|nr:unnamed protein product [Didymodactylos carnosus]CAF4085292.1 unnamed protein product [Didymodactylos carnosus]
MNAVVFLILSLLPNSISWQKPPNDETLVNNNATIIVSKIGTLIRLRNTTSIVISIPLTQHGCFLLPPKVYRQLNICKVVSNDILTQSKRAQQRENSAIYHPLSYVLEDYLSERNITLKRGKRFIAELITLAVGAAGLGLSSYNSIQISNIKNTQKRILEYVQQRDDLLKSTIASVISVTENEKLIVEELNNSRHSINDLRERYMYLANELKTVENAVNSIEQKSLPGIEEELHYGKIQASLHKPIDGKPNMDYLSKDEASQLYNTLLQRAPNFFMQFEQPLFLTANRLLTSQSFHFAINSNNTGNGNQKVNDTSLIVLIGNLIITQTFFISSDDDNYSVVYQVNSTPFFDNNSSYEVFGLPQYIAIDYLHNTSISWYNNDRNLATCYFENISFCHVLPVVMNYIENDCLKNMFTENNDRPCSYVPSAKTFPYTNNIRENQSIISVKNDTICVMKDIPDKSNLFGQLFVIKKFALVSLPCQTVMQCNQNIFIEASSRYCPVNSSSLSSIDFYMVSNGKFLKNDQVVSLIQNVTVDNKILLPFMNDANHLSSISKSISKLLDEQRRIKNTIDSTHINVNTKYFSYLFIVTGVIALKDGGDYLMKSAPA